MNHTHATLEERVRALADDLSVSTKAFMKQYADSANGISSRMSGETAALLVETRCAIELEIRALLEPIPQE